MDKPVFILRLVSGGLCALALLAPLAPSHCFAYGPVIADAGGQSAAPDLQGIYRRLDEQEIEIRQLREQVASPKSVTTSPATLPDGSPSKPTKPQADPDQLQFELEERINALEMRVDQVSRPRSDAPKGVDSSYEVGSDLKMYATWRNGVQFESQHKDFRMHVGGRIQWDISLFANDDALLVSPAVGGIGPQPDSTQFRRARVRADGTMYEVFEWVAEYDFANTLAPAAPSSGQPVATVPGLTDLTLTWTHLPVVGNFRVGNQREPMGMEHVTSDLYLDFLERSYLRDALWGPFNNGFGPGMTFFNWTDFQEATCAVGIYANDTNSFGYEIGGDLAATGRVTFCPYYDEPSDGAYLFHFGMSGSVREPDQGQVRVRTRGDIRSGPPGVLNPIYADTGTMDASQQDIAGVEAAAVWGSWTLQAEYDGTWIQDATTLTPAPVDRGTPFFHGGYVQVLYFLTGEHTIYNRRTGVFEGTIPLENAFCIRNGDHICHGNGAWQVGARYNAIDLNDNGINGGILNSFTLGINWYWTPNARVQFNYDLTHRSQVKTVEPGDINSFGTRFSYFF